MKVLIIAGMAGAGKTEFAEYCKQNGIRVINMGDLVRERVHELGLEPTSRNTARVASEERIKFGNDIWARRSTALLDKTDCIIDGTRSEAEVSYFRRSIGKSAFVIAVYAPSRIRFARLRARGREDSPLSEGEFEERDRRELGWGLGNVVALADRVVINEGTLEEFRKSVDSLLKELGIKGGVE
ncbi:MAG: AAA family ATPase [Methanomassiliicoccales archaeon]